MYRVNAVIAPVFCVAVCAVERRSLTKSREDCGREILVISRSHFYFTGRAHEGEEFDDLHCCMFGTRDYSSDGRHADSHIFGHCAQTQSHL